MKFFSMFRRGSAPIARERLQILLAHERAASSEPDLLAVLREEILAVIGRHVAFEPEKVQIKLDRGKAVSTLALDIEIPNPHCAGAIALPRPQAVRRTRRKSGIVATQNGAA